MKFAELIRNTGLNPEKFQNCANIEANLYDSKDRLSSEESIHFVEPLFKNNASSLRSFCNCISGISPEDFKSINIKVDADSVVLFYKTPFATIFFRNKSINYMD